MRKAMLSRTAVVILVAAILPPATAMAQSEAAPARGRVTAETRDWIEGMSYSAATGPAPFHSFQGPGRRPPRPRAAFTGPMRPSAPRRASP